MKFQGFLACLLLALCLGGGEAGPLQSGGESTGTNIGEALGQGTREAVGTGVRQVPGLGAADALGNRVGEAAHALGNTGHEIGTQVEDIIQHGADAVHGSWQGAPGHNSAWETSGGHGTFGSQGGLGGQGQGNPGGLGTPWSQGYPGNSAGSFGTNPQGAPWGQGGNGGSPNFGTNTQGAVAQPGYGSLRSGNQNEGCTNPPPSGSGGGSSNSGASNTGSSSGNHGGSSGGSGHKPGCENPGNEPRGTGGSGIQDFRGQGVSSSTREVSKEGNHLLGGSGDNHQGQGSSWGSRGGDAVGGVNTVNSETSSGMFNFDTFWKNFKSKLGFINWDAISKNKVSPPSTRALLYFSRLWEDFKHNTPFLNWKAIIEGADTSSLQKRAGSADQNYNYNQHAYPTAYGGQYSVKTPAKGGVSPSSSASRVQPGLLQWVKFW
ncbi:dermokine isoform X1 [Piliocolobus tephrosceles]|uniref:Dermokine n=1 Tax=Piliocolobus tephrosceles TaxID=591936 RepID=A0A8C9LNK8_9PRIM|nr:dermokine isoform X1 [Piliocolobus tephrosceles]